MINNTAFVSQQIGGQTLRSILFETPVVNGNHIAEGDVISPCSRLDIKIAGT